MEAARAIPPKQKPIPLHQSATGALPSPPDPSSLLQPILADDEQRLYRLAEAVALIPQLWDDRALLNPTLHFIDMYVTGLAFDICDGGGVIAFNRIQPNYRCQVSCALWTRAAVRAVRKHDLWRIAARVAIRTHNVLVIDGFIQADNRLARRNAERNGMQFRGIIPGAGTFQGVHKDMAWYEMHRNQLGEGSSNGQHL